VLPWKTVSIIFFCVGVGRGRVLPRVLPYLSSMQLAFAIFPAAYLAPPHFATLSLKRHDFRKKVTERKTRVLIFSTNFI
jgi:hypothetical protein